MIEVNSIDELKAYLEKDVGKYLASDEVKNLVHKAQNANLNTNVYGVYSPQYYDRRYDAGGLYNWDNLVQDNISDTEVTFTNETPFNTPTGFGGNELAGLVEYGTGWNGHWLRNGTIPRKPYANPRPFVQPTREMVQPILQADFDRLFGAGIVEVTVS